MGHLQSSTDPLAGVVLKVLELMFQVPSASYWVDVEKQNYSWYSLQGDVALLLRGSRVAVCESFISSAAVALPYAPEHESPGKLLGQCADGAGISEFENRVDTDHGLPNGPRGPARHQSFFDASVQLDSTPSIQRWAGASSGREKI